MSRARFNENAGRVFGEGIAFERMATDEKDAKLKADLEKQAAAYRKLAVQRANQYLAH